MSKITTYITKAGLLSIVKKQDLVDKYYDSLVIEMDKAGINTKNRVSAFLAQILHESGNLVYTKENLNYSADGLLKTFPSYFKDPNTAKAYERQPEKIANYVYGNRMGNSAPTDGYKYLGRGLIGVTGKNNYEILSKDTGIDFVKSPQLLEQPKYAVISAIHFWNKYGLNKYADVGNFDAISKQINLGNPNSTRTPIGKADRDSKYAALLKQATTYVYENKITSIIGIVSFFLF